MPEFLALVIFFDVELTAETNLFTEANLPRNDSVDKFKFSCFNSPPT